MDKQKIVDEFTDQLFHAFRTLIVKKCGIVIGENKRYFLKYRLGSRMEKLGFKTFYDYYAHLLNVEDGEWQKLVDEVTINETYFFREVEQLNGFIKIILPRYLRQKELSQAAIWDCACSTGEEPYTIAMLLQEAFPKQYESFRILASDIDTQVIKKAQIGLYYEKSMEYVDYYFRNRYFIRDEKTWKILQVVKDMVHFKNINLVDFEEELSLHYFDFIFCRNVLMYFENERKRKFLKIFIVL